MMSQEEDTHDRNKHWDRMDGYVAVAGLENDIYWGTSNCLIIEQNVFDKIVNDYKTILENMKIKYNSDMVLKKVKNQESHVVLFFIRNSYNNGESNEEEMLNKFQELVDILSDDAWFRDELDGRTTSMDTYIYVYMEEHMQHVLEEMNQDPHVTFEGCKNDTQVIIRILPRSKAIPEDKVREMKDKLDQLCTQLNLEIISNFFPLNKDPFPGVCGVDSIMKTLKKETEGQETESQRVAFKIHGSERKRMLQIIGKAKEIDTAAKKLKDLGVISSDIPHANDDNNKMDNSMLGSYSGQNQAAAALPRDTSNVDSSQTDDDCCICMDKIKDPKVLPCKHRYCKDCIDQHEKIAGPKCPQCLFPFGKIRGNQPPGSFHSCTGVCKLSGYESCGTIRVEYLIPNGVQTERHPHPGQPYHGTSRAAYLPDNDEGRDIEKLLEQAFNDGHIFTVGKSLTTGKDNCCVWNGIHHKTVISGAPFGYPDSDYLKRVREELRAKGIVSKEGDKKYAKK